MGNFGLNGVVLRLDGANGCACYICQEGAEDKLHCLLDCSFLRDNFSILSSNLQHKILKLDVVDVPGIVSFLNNLNRANKALLLLGSLFFLFQKQMCIMIRKFIGVVVKNILAKISQTT